jgi:RNA recognition motif-containing protein
MPKKPTLTYFCNVDDQGILNVPAKLRAEVGKVFKGMRVELTIKQKANYRSSPQNRYYWGLLVPCVLSALIELGNDLQEGNPEHIELVHDFLKNKFLQNGIDIVNAQGEVETLPSSTTRCSRFEQEEYHEKIRRWAAEYLNVSIPLPNEQVEFIF